MRFKALLIAIYSALLPTFCFTYAENASFDFQSGMLFNFFNRGFESNPSDPGNMDAVKAKTSFMIDFNWLTIGFTKYFNKIFVGGGLGYYTTMYQNDNFAKQISLKSDIYTGVYNTKTNIQSQLLLEIYGGYKFSMMDLQMGYTISLQDTMLEYTPINSNVPFNKSLLSKMPKSGTNVMQYTAIDKLNKAYRLIYTAEKDAKITIQYNGTNGIFSRGVAIQNTLSNDKEFIESKINDYSINENSHYGNAKNILMGLKTSMRLPILSSGLIEIDFIGNLGVKWNVFNWLMDKATIPLPYYILDNKNNDIEIKYSKAKPVDLEHFIQGFKSSEYFVNAIKDKEKITFTLNNKKFTAKASIKKGSIGGKTRKLTSLNVEGKNFVAIPIINIKSQDGINQIIKDAKKLYQGFTGTLFNAGAYINVSINM